tara:strand:- start:18 stop:170 length:153 start_codon:yes stop_codon:yes gene_type:complete
MLMAISRANIPKQVTVGKYKKKKNSLAKSLSSPIFKQKVAKNKKKYNRKK